MKSPRSFALLLVGAVLTFQPAFGQVTEYWNPSGSSTSATDGSGTWNSTASTWYNPGSGSNPVVWDNVSTDTAVFGTLTGTSGGNIVITGTVNTAEIELASGVNNVGYSFNDGGSGGTVVGNSGTLTIANNSTGFYSGAFFFNGLNFDASTFNFDSSNGYGIKIINSTLNNNNPVTFNLGNGSDSGLVLVAGGGFGRGDITLKVANGWTFQDGNGNSLASATVVGFGGNTEAGNGDYEYGALAITSGKGATTPVTTIPTITLTGDTLIANGDGNSGGGSSILQGAIGGSGNLYLAGGEFRDYESATGQTKANVASLIVATTNSSYTGATIITENTMNEGGSEEGPGLGYQTVALGANNALSTTGELVLGVKAGTAPISGVAAPAYTSNGVFDMAGYSQTVSGLATGSGTTASANYIGNNSGAGVSTLTVSGTSTPSSGFGGTIQDNLGTTGGKVAVALASGVLKLTGANSYSGGTTVTTGSLQITSNTGLGTGATTVTGGSGGAGTLDLQGVTVTTPINLSGSSSTNTANLINSIVSYSQTPVFGYSAGTTNITLPNVAGLSVGEAVSGTGFSNDVISAINGNVITLTTPTSSGSGGSPMPVTAGTPSVISSASSVTLVGAAANNNIGGAGSLTINATIADGASSGGFTKIGNAGLTLGGANTYTGATVAGAGVIDLANSLALQDSTLTTTANTGGVTFDSSVSSQAFTLGGLSGTGTLGLNDTANNAVALTVGNNNASTTYNGVLSGSGSVSKVGTGSLALGGSNTYSGNTSVTGGKLYVNNTTGSGTGGGNVTTTSSGGSHPVLAGSGSIAPTAGHTVTIGAGTTLSSGDVQVSDATHETITGTGLTVVNSSSTPGALLSINGGATLQFALGAGANTGDFNYANPNKDSTYMTITGDQVGEINFGLGSAINVNLVDLTALYSSQLPANQLQLRYENPVLLISAGLDSDYANLVTTGGLDQNGYVLGVGTSLTNYTAFNITVSDINNNPITSYNDLNLYLYNGQLEVIPEPSTWAMLILSLAGLGFCTWSKRRSVRVTSA